jgi:hypothetical protein
LARKEDSSNQSHFADYASENHFPAPFGISKPVVLSVLFSWERMISPLGTRRLKKDSLKIQSDGDLRGLLTEKSSASFDREFIGVLLQSTNTEPQYRIGLVIDIA